MTLTTFIASSIMGCFQQGSFEGAFSCLGGTDVGTFLIPFLLVFAIIYGILEQVDVVKGKAAALISLALSLLIAFQVQSLNLLAGLLRGISLPFVVIIVGVMLAWVIYGMVKPEVKDQDIGDSNVKLSVVVFFIIVVATLFFFGSRIFGGIGGGIGGAGFLSGNMTVILIGLILLIIIAWVLSGED